jgi:hypothetical protein
MEINHRSIGNSIRASAAVGSPCHSPVSCAMGGVAGATVAVTVSAG